VPVDGTAHKVPGIRLGIPGPGTRHGYQRKRTSDPPQKTFHQKISLQLPDKVVLGTTCLVEMVVFVSKVFLFIYDETSALFFSHRRLNECV